MEPTVPAVPPRHQAPDRRTAALLRARRQAEFLPSPPTDDEKYAFFGRQPRWPFIWLFLAQLLVVYAFVQVARRDYATLALLPFLLVLLPPTIVNLWLRMRTHRGTLDEHLALVRNWKDGTRRRPSTCSCRCAASRGPSC